MGIEWRETARVGRLFSPFSESFLFPMKIRYLFPWLVLVCALPVAAKDFEGTIHWKMSMDITDPALKAKMEAAQKQMADPAMQARMREAQAQMQNPQMQAMLAQHPEMKAMIEKQMAAMAGANQGGENPMSAMMPKGFKVTTKGGKSLVQIEGGVAGTDILTLGPGGPTYMINRSAKTYHKAPADDKPMPGEATVTVTKTSEKQDIMGYSCTKSVVEVSGVGDQSMTGSIWATSDIPGLSGKAFSEMRMGRSSRVNFMGKIDGVPLRTEMNAKGMKIAMEVDAVQPGSVDDAVFALPAGYTETATP